ncbi:MAG TPA: hypothetical protein VE175_12335 [Woeseiaceae bacterium]|nr:hypothetical protein [Woeseiaceae bacterium]
MSLQETVTNTIASLLESKVGIAAALIAVAVLWSGANDPLNAFDVHLPFRQLMLGRTLNVVMLSGRCLYAVVRSHLSLVLARRRCDRRARQEAAAASA